MTSVSLRTERCRVCGEATAPAFSTRDHNRHLSDQRFDYGACATCGTVSLLNPPVDLGRFYTSDYYRLPRSKQELLASASPAEHEKLKLVREFAPGGRLLEIGPAAGAFLAVAQAAGYHVEAIEMDGACCAFISSVLGVAVRRSENPVAALRGTGPYDAIVLWHVIEHLPDPAGLIEIAAAALAPGGILVLASPNPESLELRLLGSRWAHIDAPRHLQLITLRALKELGARHGVEPVLATTDGPGAIDYSRCGWCDSLTNTAPSGASFALRRLAGAALVRLMWPLERRGRGPAYTLVMMRRPGAAGAS
jgi:2-polyprenyl-3-methyl-5-hydroxy-6-metoxy-1,4-benzoquinol methylase